MARPSQVDSNSHKAQLLGQTDQHHVYPQIISASLQQPQVMLDCIYAQRIMTPSDQRMTALVNYKCGDLLRDQQP